MSPKTIQNIIGLNLDFYQRISKYWNKNPDYYWPGWDRLELFKKFTAQSEIKVLDIGGGNARLASYLRMALPNVKIDYWNLDFSDFLLDSAKKRLDRIQSLQIGFSYKLLKTDLSKQNWAGLVPNKYFDFVSLFGVLHHLPSANLRQKMLKTASKKAKVNSLLVFTTWQFLDLKRLQKRILDPQSNLFKTVLKNYKIDPNQLEEGDYILDWVKIELAYRYAHYFGEAECLDLLKNAELKHITNYLSDGRFDNRNRYWLATRFESHN